MREELGGDEDGQTEMNSTCLYFIVIFDYFLPSLVLSSEILAPKLTYDM